MRPCSSGNLADGRIAHQGNKGKQRSQAAFPEILLMISLSSKSDRLRQAVPIYEQVTSGFEHRSQPSIAFCPFLQPFRFVA
jgi:hypothetical protein